MRAGQRTTWVDPDDSNRYTVMPTRTYKVGGGPWREFRLDTDVGGDLVQEICGTPCLQADGIWLIVRERPGPNGTTARTDPHDPPSLVATGSFAETCPSRRVKFCSGKCR